MCASDWSLMGRYLSLKAPLSPVEACARIPEEDEDVFVRPVIAAEV